MQLVEKKVKLYFLFLVSTIKENSKIPFCLWDTGYFTSFADSAKKNQTKIGSKRRKKINMESNESARESYSIQKPMQTKL